MDTGGTQKTGQAACTGSNRKLALSAIRNSHRETRSLLPRIRPLYKLKLIAQFGFQFLDVIIREHFGEILHPAFYQQVKDHPVEEHLVSGRGKLQNLLLGHLCTGQFYFVKDWFKEFFHFFVYLAFQLFGRFVLLAGDFLS